MTNRLKLLTSDEEASIKRLIMERKKFPELKDLWNKYNLPLIKCLDQLVGGTTRRKMVQSRCPIEIFQNTLKEIIFRQKIPSKSDYTFNEAQLDALKILLNEFQCGSKCPCCPASIIG